MKNIFKILFSSSATLLIFAQSAWTKPLWIDGEEGQKPPLEVSLPSFAPMIEKLGPSVVNISIEGKEPAHANNQMFQRPGPGGQQSPFDFFFQLPQEGQSRRIQSLGSGFVIHPDGYIVTNYHVVEKAAEINVTFKDDKKTYDAKVIGTDKKTDLSIWKEHFHYSMPLIFSLLLSGSADYIDGALVSSHFGSDSFAIFRYGAKELPISLLLANSLSLAFVPKLANKSQFEEGLTQLKKESLKLMHLLFPISIILLLSSHWLYPHFFRFEFIKSASIFNIYLVLIISRMVFPQTIIMALQETGIIFKIAVIEITVNVIASYLLMLKFGMAGVAWGTIIAFSAEKLILMIVLYKKRNISVTKYLATKEWIIYSLLLMFCYFLVENFIN